MTETLCPVAEVDVERAIAEIRAGRGVLLYDGCQTLFVIGADSLDSEAAERLAPIAQGAARLALTASRLARLGLERDGAGFVALPEIDLDRIGALAFSARARIDAPVTVAGPLYESALELLRLSYVLPAALVIPVDNRDNLRGLLSAPAAAVDAYRVKRARTLRIVSRAFVPLDGAPDSEFVVFRGGEGLRDQVAIVVGKPVMNEPVIVRLHSACLTGDLFGSLKCDCGDQLRHATRYMAENGGGVLLYTDQEGRGNGLSNKIRAYDLQSHGHDTFDADEILGFSHDQRRFDCAAVMLQALGVYARAADDEQSGKNPRARGGGTRRRLRSPHSRAQERS